MFTGAKREKTAVTKEPALKDATTADQITMESRFKKKKSLNLQKW